TAGSFSATEGGLRACPAATGEAPGDGTVATAAVGDAAAAVVGLGAGVGTAGIPVEAGAVVGADAWVGVAGAGALGPHPIADSSVAVEAMPPVMCSTRLISSLRVRYPSL